MNLDTIERIARHRGTHLRVLGPPASGKTTALVARFRALEADGLRPAVIAFSRAQRERLLHRLMPRGTARAGRFPVHTYHQLALDVPLMPRPLTDVEERVVLARVLDDLDGALESDFATVISSDGLARTLLSIIHTLEQNGVGVDEATTALANAKGRRTRDVLRVFAGFEQTLESRGLCTYYAVSWRAARALTGNVDVLGDCGALLIDDMHDIDAGQFALIEALAAPEGERTVTAFGDPTGARFGFRGTDARFLGSAFPERYGGDDMVLPMPDSGLGPVAVQILEAAGVENAGRFVAGVADATGDLPLFAATGPAAGGVDVTLTVAEDDVAEAQHVARACAALIDGGTAPGDIAVIARDRGRYELVLAHAFDEFGVPLDTGEPQRHELETFADALLGLLEARSDDRLAGTVADSPFYRVLHTIDIDDLIARLRRDCFDRKTRVLGMQKFLDATVRPAATAVPVSDEAVAAVARMADEWSAYEEMAAHIGARASVSEFRRRYRPAVCLDRDPRCVAFHTAREAATHTVNVAFVVGCAEGVFPALDVRESYVPYGELESLLPVTFYEARERDERLRDDYGLMLSALTRGRDAVHATAPRTVAGEEVPAPARVLKPLVGAERAVRQEGARTRAVRLVAAAGHGNVSAPSAAGTARVWLEAPLETRRFAVEAFAMSPSRLGTYVECPRKLFYTRILGVDEETNIYLTLGSLFHETLEKVGKAMPSRDEIAARLTPERIAGFVDETVGASRDLGPSGSLVESLTRYYLERMVAHVAAIERRRAGALDVAVEMDGMFQRGDHAFRGKIDRVDSAGQRPRVVIDYKTTKPGGANSIHKTGKSIREYMLGEKGREERRYWQVPMYLEGTKSGGAYPDLFCYYVVSPGYDPYVAGLFVSDDPDRHKDNEYFPGGKRAFATVSPAEIATVMDEVTSICDQIFGERDRFPRTDDRKKCRYCSFNGVCERREAS